MMSFGKSFAKIPPVPQSWLWRNRIPIGEVTILSAFGGTGKGLFSCDLAARISKGWPLIDSGPAVPAQSVLMASVEDDSNVVLANRLLAAGADMERVHDMSTIGDRAFSLPTDVQRMADLASDIGDVGLVILDPFARMAEKGVGYRRNVSYALNPVQMFCNTTGIPVLLLHHVDKNGKVNGSQAVKDNVRSVLLMKREESNAKIRTITVDKSNGGDENTMPVQFMLEGDGSDVHVKWLIDGMEDPHGAKDEIRRWMLANGKRKPASSGAISNATGIPYQDARILLTQMADDGFVSQPFSGWFQLTRKGYAND